MYRWLDHTAELELEIEADTEQGVLYDALMALRELLEGEAGPPQGTESARRRAVGAAAAPAIERRAVRACARDRPALLAGWLEELLFLAETSGIIPFRIEQLSLSDEALAAIVAGRVGEPRPLVKAITYHRLAFEPSERGYRGRVVFDV